MNTRWQSVIGGRVFPPTFSVNTHVFHVVEERVVNGIHLEVGEL